MTRKVIPEQRMYRMFKIIRMLNAGEMNVSRIAKKIRMHERTAYRYIRIMTKMGLVRVDKRKAKRHFTIKCPCCGVVKICKCKNN